MSKARATPQKVFQLDMREVARVARDPVTSGKVRNFENARSEITQF